MVLLDPSNLNATSRVPDNFGYLCWRIVREFGTKSIRLPGTFRSIDDTTYPSNRTLLSYARSSRIFDAYYK